ncbi:hypothetical protein EDC04DRAFT_2592023, partial [Pisolithus marmoratus]
CLYQTCQSMVASSGETCRLGGFVLAQDPHAASLTLPLIGCLHELLQICHSPAQQCNQANWILLETSEVTGSADIYNLLWIQASSWVVLLALTCCINVQHSCARHRCTGLAAVSVYEECEKTMKTMRRIEHLVPSDLILNTAQMCNATHMQQFHTQVQQLHHNRAIHTGAAAELNAQKIMLEFESPLCDTLIWCEFHVIT